MSKNLFKGDLAELKVSLKIHNKHRALLISPLLLRRMNMGQIDVSFVFNKAIYLIEVKSSSITTYISFDQKERIRKTAEFLSRILELDVKVMYLNSCQMKGHYLTFKR